MIKHPDQKQPGEQGFLSCLHFQETVLPKRGQDRSWDSRNVEAGVDSKDVEECLLMCSYSTQDSQPRMAPPSGLGPPTSIAYQENADDLAHRPAWPGSFSVEVPTSQMTLCQVSTKVAITIDLLSTWHLRSSVKLLSFLVHSQDLTLMSISQNRISKFKSPIVLKHLNT